VKILDSKVEKGGFVENNAIIKFTMQNHE